MVKKIRQIKKLVESIDKKGYKGIYLIESRERNNCRWRVLGRRKSIISQKTRSSC